MPFTDLIQKHLTTAEKTQVDTLLSQIEAIILPKSQNLSAEERSKYGSINEQNKLFVNKIRDYLQTEPSLASPDVNWVEYEADYQDRSFLDTRINRMVSIIQTMTDAKILHDYDNYRNALMDYRFTKYKDETGIPGFEIKHNECKQFFPNSSD